MNVAGKSIRLTMAQALIRHLAAQYIETPKGEERLVAGGFGIFGHGNVICLGEAFMSIVIVYRSGVVRMSNPWPSQRLLMLKLNCVNA